VRVAVVRGLFDPAACAVLGAAIARLALPRISGRQATGYDKADLVAAAGRDATVDVAVAQLVAVLGRPAAYDAWWLSYPDGSHIPPHTDESPAPGLAHVRVNVVITKDGGGVLRCDDQVVDLAVGDAVVFRPDVVVHAVSAVVGAPRLVLSVGTVMAVGDAERLIDAARRQK